MKRWTQVEDLLSRQKALSRVAYIALGAGALAVLVTMAHIETGAGEHFSDVHLPADWLRERMHGSFQFGEPYSIGRGPARIIHWIELVAFGAIQLGLWGVLFWAFKNKRREWVLATFAFSLFIGALTPVPKVLFPGVAKGASVSTAEGLLRLDRAPSNSIFRIAQSVDDQASNYVRAQIAYIHGDRAQVRALVSNINLDYLASPIEAPYRLQFLQGRYRGLTTVCFKLFGCLEEQRREERMQLFMWLSIVLLVIGLNAALIAAVLERRLTRINHLGIQRSLAGKSWLA